jgi:hypothetical protein
MLHGNSLCSTIQQDFEGFQDAAVFDREIVFIEE